MILATLEIVLIYIRPSVGDVLGLKRWYLTVQIHVVRQRIVFLILPRRPLFSCVDTRADSYILKGTCADFVFNVLKFLKVLPFLRHNLRDVLVPLAVHLVLCE